MLLGVATLVLSSCTGEASDEPSPSAESSTPVPSPELAPTSVPRPVLDSLAGDATSGDPRQVARAMVVPRGQSLDAAFVEQLGDLTIDFLPETAVVLAEGQVRIDAEVTAASGDVRRWYVVLDEVRDSYRISTTSEVS